MAADCLESSRALKVDHGVQWAVLQVPGSSNIPLKLRRDMVS